MVTQMCSCLSHIKNCHFRNPWKLIREDESHLRRLQFPDYSWIFLSISMNHIHLYRFHFLIEKVPRQIQANIKVSASFRFFWTSGIYFLPFSTPDFPFHPVTFKCQGIFHVFTPSSSSFALPTILPSLIAPALPQHCPY